MNINYRIQELTEEIEALNYLIDEGEDIDISDIVEAINEALSIIIELQNNIKNNGNTKN